MSEDFYGKLGEGYQQRLNDVLDNKLKDGKLLKILEDDHRYTKDSVDRGRIEADIDRLRQSIKVLDAESKMLVSELETLQGKQQTEAGQVIHEAQITSLRQELQQHQQTLLDTLQQELQQHQQSLLDTLRQELQHQQTETGPLHQPSAATGISFIHSYTLSEIWADRDRELSELESEIQENRYRIIALISIGGGGKSALVRKLLKNLLDKAKLPRCLWFSFSENADVNLFLAQAFKDLLPDLELNKYPDSSDKAHELKNWLAQNRCLLVLDGLETVLESDWKSSTFGKCADAVLSNFLKGICSDQGLSQLIITSRYPLSELKDQEGYRAIDLPDILPEAAVKYMHQRGVRGSPSNITEVYARHGYHILSLSVLADYLSMEPYSGDISGMKNLDQLPTENEQGSKLQSILNYYWEKLTPAGCHLITRLTAFRANVTMDILKLLATDNDGHYCEMNHPEFHLALRRLLESKLLKSEQGSARTTNIVYPLIKTYFYNRLGQEESRKIHIELKDRLRLVPLPDMPQTLDDLNTQIEIYHHCIRARLYDEAYKTYRDQGLNRHIFWWGEYTFALELLRPLLEAYKDGTWTTSPDRAGYILQEAGIIVSKSGDPSSALNYHQQSIEAPDEDRALQLKGWLYQSELCMEMGNFDKAEKALEKARKVEGEMKESGQTVKEYLVSGCEGYYYAATGRIEDAEKQLMTAIMLCQDKDTGNLAYCCLYLRIRGDLYLNTNRLSEAEADYEKALAISRDPANVFKDYEGHVLRGLGDFYRVTGEYVQAQDRYDQALDIAKNKGYIWLEAEVGIGQARLALANDNLVVASDQANKVLDLLKGKQWFIQQIQAHIVLAKASQGSQEGAKAHIETARNLLSKADHFWSRNELQELNVG